MTPRVQLLVSEWCTPCRAAEETWRLVAVDKDIAFEVLDVGQVEGRAIVARLAIKTVPASVVDGVLRHVGVPTRAEALAFVAGAADRRAGASRPVGLTMAQTSRWALAAAAIYLGLAGAALVLGGGLAGTGAWRAAALHAYGLGFLAFAIFGLGEHMLPRFTGAPIRGGAIAWTQQGLGHAGLVLLVAGTLVGQRGVAFAGGTLAATAFAVFAVRLAPVLRHGS